MLELIPPKDMAKRKEFFYKKLTKTSNQLAALMENRDSAIDALFADIDKSVMQVRDSLSAAAVQLKQFSAEEWQSIRHQADLRQETECPICCAAFEPSHPSSDEQKDDDTAAIAPSIPLAKRQVLLSCSHLYHFSCIQSFERFTVASSALDGVDKAMLQSHQQRLDELNEQDADTMPLLQPPPVCVCPLCRANYQKAWM